MTGTHATGEARLIRGQALSGLVFGAFLAIHLANTIAGAFGEEAYNRFMAAARGWYQIAPVEILGVGLSALAHGYYGIRRALRRRARRRSGAADAAPGWLRLHRASGWVLLLVIVGHVAATRGPALLEDLPAEFSLLRFSLESWPLLMWPYYFLLFSAGTYHLLHGGLIALNVIGVRTGAPTARWARALLLAALLAGSAGVLSMGGVWGEADNSNYAAYRDIYERYAPLLANLARW
ncbi:MAG: hypothetical protein AAF682_25810 [Planctomycetota bacterium]